MTNFPFIRSNHTLFSFYLQHIIALIPAAIIGIFQYGEKAVFALLIAILSFTAGQTITERLQKKSLTWDNIDCFFHGMLIGLCMSAYLSIPLIGIISCAGGIFKVFTKKSGQYFISPVIFSVLLLYILTGNHYSYPLIGSQAIALFIGWLYLVLLRQKDSIVPIVYLVTLTIISLSVYIICNIDFVWKIPSSVFLLSALFLLTDSMKTPISFGGKISFGIIAGVCAYLTMFFFHGLLVYCVSIAIAQLFVPILDFIFIPKPKFTRKETYYEISD